MLPALIPVNGRTLGEILSMPEAFAIPLLESSKANADLMQTAYDYESAHKCRYTMLTTLRSWIAEARVK